MHYDQAGRLIGEMIRGGAAGENVAADMTVTGGVSTTEKAGLHVTGEGSTDA